jgi:iron complex outermembrane receptor protein
MQSSKFISAALSAAVSTLVDLRTARRRNLFASFLLLSFLVSPLALHAQSTTSLPDAPTPVTPKKVPTVVTTVEVRGNVEQIYAPANSTLGGFEELPLAQTPHSGLVVTRSVLDDQQARILSDVTKNDASIGDDYAPVGYYEDFQIRGFPIDLATGLKVDGLTIAGEQIVPLENKERVEFLKGLPGIEAGVASPGGLINYVTKPVAVVRSVELATDQRGTIFGHLDIGSLWGTHRQFGLRANAGAENIRSYVNDADGSREFGTAAGSWNINTETSLTGSFEYQHQVQRSVAGYQLLGGTTLPTDIHPATMLGEQPWAKPNTFDAVNANLRLNRKLTENWSTYVTGGLSRSLIDDNIAYPYGCYHETACNTGSAPYPWFFSPTGDYDVYDYRSPGELRIDNQFEAILQGHHALGAIENHIIVGTSLLRRSVVLSTPVYDYVGTDNIYQPLQTFQPSPLTPGLSALQEDSHQYAVVLEDRVELPGRVTASVAGQIDTLHDHNFTQIDVATQQPLPGVTDKTMWLPQYSLTYRPVEKLMLYSDYSVALSLGLQAPAWVTQGIEFLSPFLTRQLEIGAKFAASDRLLLTATVFRMRSPFFYPKAVGGELEFLGEGHETHNGAEFTAQGKVTRWLQLTTSAAAISAISDETGTPAFDNKQVINQPRFRSTVFADVAVPGMAGLSFLPGWSYTGRKAATRDDSVSVPGYNLFSLGMRYTPHGGHSRMTFHIYADNITDKRYWKDTGANYGDTFLHVGAPTTVRLATKFTF